MLRDANTYECIWRGRRTISTVWLQVNDPQPERIQAAWLGDSVLLPCYIHISKGQAYEDLHVWWTKDGNTIASLDQGHVQIAADHPSRFTVWTPDTMEDFGLIISPVLIHDHAEYRCLYTTRPSDDPKPGIPESVTLTVLGTGPTHTGFYLNETDTVLYHNETDTVLYPNETETVLYHNETETVLYHNETETVLYHNETETVLYHNETETVTETWTNASTRLDASVWTERATTETEAETTASPPDPTPLLLGDATQPQPAASSSSQPMEAMEETVTSFPDEGTQEDQLDSAQSETLPWVRIGLIAGVLVVTAVLLCILGALRKI
ncbi:uncharacterized protein LOC115375388 [Myripristis murdjan]|uniref:uncharacterized protein LOC115375388 n=1 Tax=Myripristis murdjan TaxID=586833 RepID=UPI0011761070|nr:uncharacterized protein LOC115375388 [Myripristis murdjan]